jgi:flagellin
VALSIANNVSSLNAQHNLNRASARVAKSVERLSSGVKVNRGADGPAALVISEKQRAQIAGLRSAIDNSEKAVSVVQTAEGALSEINSLLVKVRSLAIDSANEGVNDSDALAANQSEIDNALETINRIANNTQFGTRKLLEGSSGISGVVSNSAVTFLKGTTDTQAGNYSVAVTTTGQRGTTTASTAQTTTLSADETLTINNVSVTLTSGMTQNQVVDRINEFSAQTGVTADINSGSTRLYTNAFGADESVSVVSNVTAAGTSSGFGTSVATDSGRDIAGTINGSAFTGSGNVATANTGNAKGISLQIAAASGVIDTETGALGTVSAVDNSLNFQIGANAGQTANIAIASTTTSALGFGVAGNQFNNLSEINVLSASKAADSLAVVDAAIDEITNARGTLGAFQANTLESTANNLRATLENTVNAESVIRDTDFAAEIAEFTKNQVLVQAGTSVLGNANQIPQQVLALL